MTPVAWGVSNASERGTKSEVAHKPRGRSQGHQLSGFSGGPSAISWGLGGLRGGGVFVNAPA